MCFHSGQSRFDCVPDISYSQSLCSETPGMLAQVQQTEALGIDPIVDYIFPIWPSLNCFNPARTDNSTITPSAGFTNYYNAVQSKANQFITTGLFFTAQCVPASEASRDPSTNCKAEQTKSCSADSSLWKCSENEEQRSVEGWKEYAVSAE